MKNRPNIVVILCDQLRPDFLGCYGGQGVKTPNIDSIAVDGVLFEHAVTASPVCAPGRACMMTGRYVSDNGVWTNDMPFREGIEFLPQRMNENGYRTGCFGKLHHYPAKDTKGFQVSCQMEERRLKEDDDYYKWLKKFHPDAESVFPRGKDGLFKYDERYYCERYIEEKAVEFISEGTKDKPFLAWISFQGPHGPLTAPKSVINENEDKIPEPHDRDYNPKPDIAMYRKSMSNSRSFEEIMEYRRQYCRRIKEIDDRVGDILKCLKENNIYKDTLIIFTTDHGDLCGDYNMWGKGPYIYAAQLEVPFLVANSGVFDKGTRSDMLVSNIDVPGTLLYAAGDKKEIGYSRSVEEMYTHKELQRKSIYSEYCDIMKVVSTKEYRFAYYPFTGQCQLVRIDNEKEDLAGNPQYESLKNKFFMEIIDFMIVSSGVHIEAQDLVPSVQEGLEEKYRGFKDKLTLAFPIKGEVQRRNLRRDGLNDQYNEFCKTRYVARFYSKYWEKNKK